MDTVSVVIPTKNRVNLLIRAIESVLKQVNINTELIVVDDGSEDYTSRMARLLYPEISLVTNTKSMGAAIARNQGALIACADYLAFLDSDDEWLENHLCNKIEILKSTNCEGVFGTFIAIWKHKRWVERFYPHQFDKTNIGNCISFTFFDKPFHVQTSTMVFKRKSFLEVQFDENLLKHQDWDLAINFHIAHSWVCDKNPTVQLHYDAPERMTASLNNASTIYFLNKNKSVVNSNKLFLFTLCMIAENIKINNKQCISIYLNYCKGITNQLDYTHKLMFNLLKKNVNTSLFFSYGSLYYTIWFNRLKKIFTYLFT